MRVHSSEIRSCAVQITLTPDFNTFTFDGAVLIVINCIEATSEILLHAKELTIDENSIQIGDDTTELIYTVVVGVEYEKQYDFMRIKMRDPFEKGGRYRLYIPYKGILNDDLDGFYRSSYKVNGERR